MRKLSLILALTCVALLAMTGLAFAAHSAANGDSLGTQGDPITQTTYNDPDRSAAGGCNACHGYENVQENTRGAYGSGPHGGYTENSGKCTTCHTIHTGAYGMDAKKATNTTLLPGNTVTAVCNYCHDLTGTQLAPYSTRYLYDQGNAGTGINSGHFVEGAVAGEAMKSLRNGDATGTVVNQVYLKTSGAVVPGGSSTTGGTVDITADLFNQGDFNTANGGEKIFTCNSCHTPHAITGSTVDPYFGESKRIDISAKAATSRLLKKTLLADQVGTIDNYGSAWCAGCHQGRNTMAGAGNYNHKVNATGLGYLTMANLASYGANAVDVTGLNIDGAGVWGDSDYDTARTNAWYSMTTDLTGLVAEDPISGAPRPDGSIKLAAFPDGPSCQQCHASARDVEKSITDASQFAPVGSDVYTGQPITTFPHVSRTKVLLVEDGDDLCTNCHGLSDLP